MRSAVLRRDHVGHEHFRVVTVVPWLGVASCVLLLTQQSGETWLRAGALLLLGLLLYLTMRIVGRGGAEAASSPEEASAG